MMPTSRPRLSPHALLPRLAAILALALLLTLVVTDKRATTKMTWEERRGFPFTVATLTEYHPCRLDFLCTHTVDTLAPLAILLDLALAVVLVELGARYLLRRWRATRSERGAP